jgi:F-type H+-transporting ATPase subunit b
MTIDLSFVLVILNFILLLIILNNVLYKPLKAYFSDRQNKIKADIDEANQSIEKANQLVIEKDTELKNAFLEARNIKDKITKDAEIHAEKIIQSAKQTELDVIQDTEIRLKELNKKAKEELEFDLADIVIDLTKKVLFENMDAEKDRALINKLLAERGKK